MQATAKLNYMRALAIDERALGSNHPNVASDMSNLADLYMLHGRIARAEVLYKRALAIYQKTLGPEHLVVADSRKKLALLDNSRNVYAQVENVGSPP